VEEWDGKGWDGSERQRERWEQQAALETGTGTETVIDRNHNCEGQQENTFLEGEGGDKICGKR